MIKEKSIDNSKIKEYLLSISIAEINLTKTIANSLQRAGLQSAYDVAFHYMHGTLINLKFMSPSYLPEINNKIGTLLESLDIYYALDENDSTTIIGNDDLNVVTSFDLDNNAGINSYISNLFLAERMNTKIEELELPKRITHALLRAGLKTVYDINSHIQDGSLTKLNNIGETTRDEVINFMNSFLKDIHGNRDNQIRRYLFKQNISFLKKNNYHKLPITFLEDELGKNVVQFLLAEKINTIEELLFFSMRIQDICSIIPNKVFSTLEKLKSELNKKIKNKILHPDAQYLNKKLVDWINCEIDISSSLPTLKELKKLNKPVGIIDDFKQLFQGISTRNLEIFLDYYSNNSSTLESIGEKYQVTRERIRQVVESTKSQVMENFSGSPCLYFQSAILFGNDLGNQFSINVWKSLLRSNKLISNDEKYEGHDLFCLLSAILLSAQDVMIEKFDIKTQLFDLFDQPSDLTLGTYSALNQLSPEKVKQILRQVSYTGGIHLEDLSNVLELAPRDFRMLIADIGLEEVIPNWFTISGKEVTHSKWPIMSISLQVIKFCGPVELEVLGEGIKRSIKRHFKNVVPYEVLRNHLEKLDFIIKGQNVFLPEDIDESSITIPESEVCFLELFQSIGPVLNTQEVIEAIQNAGFSASTATSRVLPNSPIVEQIVSGFYTLRGQKISIEDLQDANERVEK